MMYLILRWDGEHWEILHYSHQWEDAERMYGIFKDRFGNIQLFADVRVLQFHDAMLKAKELAAAIKRKNEQCKNKSVQ